MDPVFEALLDHLDSRQPFGKYLKVERLEFEAMYENFRDGDHLIRVRGGILGSCIENATVYDHHGDSDPGNRVLELRADNTYSFRISVEGKIILVNSSPEKKPTEQAILLLNEDDKSATYYRLT
ncbi:hypothetical protein GOV12_05835 [Candidatus Pacearchaeota archaeon]|nr:hypothetical protein [Candidatus Pacearchaeota archaeon]